MSRLANLAALASAAVAAISEAAASIAIARRNNAAAKPERLARTAKQVESITTEYLQIPATWNLVGQFISYYSEVNLLEDRVARLPTLPDCLTGPVESQYSIGGGPGLINRQYKSCVLDLEGPAAATLAAFPVPVL